MLCDQLRHTVHSFGACISVCGTASDLPTYIIKGNIFYICTSSQRSLTKWCPHNNDALSSGSSHFLSDENFGVPDIENVMNTEDDVTIINTSQSQEVLSTQLLQAAATDREAERERCRNNSNKSPREDKPGGKNLDQTCLRLAIERPATTKVGNAQPITGALPTNFGPIIHVVVHLTMQISVM